MILEELFVSFLHSSPNLDLSFPRLNRLPLIPPRFTLAQPQFHLRPTTPKMNIQRNQSMTLLVQVAVELIDLPLMQQQLTRASRSILFAK